MRPRRALNLRMVLWGPSRGDPLFFSKSRAWTQTLFESCLSHLLRVLGMRVLKIVLTRAKILHLSPLASAPLGGSDMLVLSQLPDTFYSTWASVYRLIPNARPAVTGEPMSQHLTRGSKYPTFRDSGSKNHTLYGFWTRVLHPKVPFWAVY